MLLILVLTVISTLSSTGFSNVNDVITLTLNFSNQTLLYLPDGQSCIEEGLKYHIHEFWNHNDNNVHIGESDCSSSYTGGHWDPWLASGTGVTCGSSSYTCNTSIFEDNPYSCEIGDWSGKYGIMSVDYSDINDDRLIANITFTSDYEVSGADTVNRSIVFHCGSSNKRAFCAPLINDTQFIDSTCDYGECCSQIDGECDYFQTIELSNHSILQQSDLKVSYRFTKSVYTNGDGNNNNRRPVDSESDYTFLPVAHGATFGSSQDIDFRRLISTDSSIIQDALLAVAIFDVEDPEAAKLLGLDGDTDLLVIVSNTQFVDELTLPSDCGDNLLYRVYQEWNGPNNMNFSLNGTECDEYVGNFYDPTATCEMDSDNEVYCNCSDYRCNSDEYLNGINRFGCSPSDLSGKYGAISINNSQAINLTFYDDLSIRGVELTGKSLAIQCENTHQIVACAKFRQYNETFGADVDTTDFPMPSNTDAETTPTIEPGTGESDSDGASRVFISAVGTAIMMFISFYLW